MADGDTEGEGMADGDTEGEGMAELVRDGVITGVDSMAIVAMDSECIIGCPSAKRNYSCLVTYKSCDLSEFVYGT